MDVLDRVLDKGIVVDAHVRICVTGVHLLDVDARIVVASIATYLTYSDVLAATVSASSLPRSGGMAAPAGKRWGGDRPGGDGVRARTPGGD